MAAIQSAPIGRVPSPVPRPSYSSGRSRLSPDDFENALLNPNHTVFLSGSPGLEVVATPPRSRTPGRDDAPHSIEKRSFEEDMRIPDTPEKRVTPGVGIVPPTPSSVATSQHSRRPSQATMGSDGTPTRMRVKGPSIGLDGKAW